MGRIISVFMRDIIDSIKNTDIYVKYIQLVYLVVVVTIISIFAGIGPFNAMGIFIGGLILLGISATINPLRNYYRSLKKRAGVE